MSNTLPLSEVKAKLSDPSAVRGVEEGRAAIAGGDIVTRDEIEALRKQLRDQSS